MTLLLNILNFVMITRLSNISMLITECAKYNLLIKVSYKRDSIKSVHGSIRKFLLSGNNNFRFRFVLLLSLFVFKISSQLTIGYGCISLLYSRMFSLQWLLKLVSIISWCKCKEINVTKEIIWYNIFLLGRDFISYVFLCMIFKQNLFQRRLFFEWVEILCILYCILC